MRTQNYQFKDLESSGNGLQIARIQENRRRVGGGDGTCNGYGVRHFQIDSIFKWNGNVKNEMEYQLNSKCTTIE